MRYIDTDHLKMEIEKHITEVKDAAKRFTPNMGFFDAKLSGIYDVMAIIDSLQQDLPGVDLGKETEKYFKGWTETDEGIACHYQYVDLNTCRGIARHFYELGKLNARKEE